MLGIWNSSCPSTARLNRTNRSRLTQLARECACAGYRGLHAILERTHEFPVFVLDLYQFNAIPAGSGDCRRSAFPVEAMRKTPGLAQVSNPRGRVDVALYRIAERVMEKLETEQKFIGLRENLLPIVEDVISQNFPAKTMLPREVEAVLEVFRLNANRSLNGGKG